MEQSKRNSNKIGASFDRETRIVFKCESCGHDAIINWTDIDSIPKSHSKIRYLLCKECINIPSLREFLCIKEN